MKQFNKQIPKLTANMFEKNYFLKYSLEKIIIVYKK